jgi:DNA-binding LacI/PurR family transcriptional regulator
LLKEDSPQAYVSQRHQGYLEAMSAAGLEVLAEDVITARNSRLFAATLGGESS